MKVIYFYDPAGDVKLELKSIKDELKKNNIKLEIEATDTPPWERKYDILFFDWGGMSLGNSMLEHFCEHFINEAREHPSRIYIMTSLYTKNAMEDALSYLDRETEEPPANIFLSIEKAIPYLKEIVGK